MARMRFWNLDEGDRISLRDLAWNASCGVTNVFISNCAYWSVHGHVGGDATRELIGAHKILEPGKPLTFVPIFLNL
jgi:hypothetical protein